MSSPNVAGTAVLLIEHFEDEFLTSAAERHDQRRAHPHGRPTPATPAPTMPTAGGWSMPRRPPRSSPMRPSARRATVSKSGRTAAPNTPRTSSPRHGPAQVHPGLDRPGRHRPSRGPGRFDPGAGPRPGSVGHRTRRDLLPVDPESRQSDGRRRADPGEPRRQRRASADRRPGGRHLYGSRGPHGHVVHAGLHPSGQRRSGRKPADGRPLHAGRQCHRRGGGREPGDQLQRARPEGGGGQYHDQEVVRQLDRRDDPGDQRPGDDRRPTWRRSIPPRTCWRAPTTTCWPTAGPSRTWLATPGRESATRPPGTLRREAAAAGRSRTRRRSRSRRATGRSAPTRRRSSSPGFRARSSTST